MAPEQKVEEPDWNWNWEEEEEPEESESDSEMLGPHMEQQWSPAFADLGKSDCDCPGLPPPPRFALPPPPLPFSAAPRCPLDDDPHNAPHSGLSELEYCDVQVLEGPYTQTAIPSIAVIVVCSFIVLVTILVASLIFWRHKRKMQNFLPCKTSPANHCDVQGGGSTVLYEDLTNIRPRNMMANHCAALNQSVAPMEMMDQLCSSAFRCFGYVQKSNFVKSRGRSYER